MRITLILIVEKRTTDATSIAQEAVGSCRYRTAVRMYGSFERCNLFYALGNWAAVQSGHDESWI